MNNKPITLYTKEGCPKCLALKRELLSKNVKYTEVSDVDEMIALGLQEVPMLDVSGRLMKYNEAMSYIKEGANAN